jgi:hypothetical protein
VILKALQYIGAKRPYFDIIGADGSLYMGRWWLLGGSARDSDEGRPVSRTWKRGRLDAWIGKWIAARLHHIAREDRARDFHNHPASFVSIVVKGWYVERRPKRRHQPAWLDTHLYVDTVRRAGSIAFRRAADFHTITEVCPEGCWTVVIWFRKRGSWGFRTPSGFVNWRRYGISP